MSAAHSSTHDSSARGPDPGARRSMRRRGVRGGLAAVLALMVMAVAAPSASAQQQNWECDAYGYLYQTRDTGEHLITQVDLATGASNDAYRNLERSVNAWGFNVVDGFFYGMALNETTNTGSWRESIPAAWSRGSGSLRMPWVSR
jgi:hypothetical protein